MRDFTLPLDVAIKERVHDDGAARVGEQLAAEADQTAAGHAELNADASVTVVVHVFDFTLART